MKIIKNYNKIENTYGVILEASASALTQGYVYGNCYEETKDIHNN